MKLYLIALVISLFYCGLIIFLTEVNRHEIKINCSIAEISPDIPPKAKEQCRQQRKN